MRFDAFVKEYGNLSIIDSGLILSQSGHNAQVLRNQLSRWSSKGYIVPLRKGLYFLEKTNTSDVNEYYLANKLYEPSYLSLESALSFYSMIPERVYTFTSISTKKTQSFKNKFGVFIYRHIKPECFRGFKIIDFFGKKVFIAEAEKALVDFLYFNLSVFKKDVKKQLIESYRLKEFHVLSVDKLMSYAEFFSNKKLLKVISACVELVGEFK